MVKLENYYHALALQSECRCINVCPDRDSARAKISDNIVRVGQQIRAAQAFIGPDVRLVVLPEYLFTGYPMGDTIAGWAHKCAFDLNGAEYEALAQVAQDNGTYLAVNAYETDPHFDGLYFQACVVFSDSGDVCLRYRRLISMYAPTPHDVLDPYLDHYGEDALFPVADTPLGRLAAIASEEILYPEIARALAVRGAEIFLHSSSESGSPMPTVKHVAKLARAAENTAYVISANTGGIADGPMPESSADYHSMIVDYHGHAVVQAAGGESMVAHAILDVEGLRTFRRRPGMFNPLARQRLDLFASTYADRVHYPANNLIDSGRQVLSDPPRKHFVEQQSSVIDALVERGVIR